MVGGKVNCAVSHSGDALLVVGYSGKAGGILEEYGRG